MSYHLRIGPPAQESKSCSCSLGCGLIAITLIRLTEDAGGTYENHEYLASFQDHTEREIERGKGGLN